MQNEIPPQIANPPNNGNPAQSPAPQKKYCNERHIQSIISYCKTCRVYICETCQMEEHFAHEIEFLEVEASRIVSEYQKLYYEARTKLKQCEYLLANKSKDEILSNLSSRVSKTFDELITKIIEMKERKIKELMGSNEVQKYLLEYEKIEEHKLLVVKEIEIDAAKMFQQAKEGVEKKNFIQIFELNSGEEIADYRGRLAKEDTNPTHELLSLQDNLKSMEIRVDMNYLQDIYNKIDIIFPLTEAKYSYYFDNECNQLILFNMESKKFKQTGIMSDKIQIPYHFSSYLLGSDIYFIGGDDDGYRADASKLSLDTWKLTELPQIPGPRRNCGLSALSNQLLFVIGGFCNPEGLLGDCQMLDIHYNKWYPLPTLNVPRQYPGSCVFNKSIIFVFGDGEGTIERLNFGHSFNMLPLLPQLAWDIVTLTPPLPSWTDTPRSGPGVVQLSDTQIMLFGGCRKLDFKDVYIYNVDSGELREWVELPEGGLFYQHSVVKGLQYLSSVDYRRKRFYCYDIYGKVWTIHSMPEITTRKQKGGKL